MKETPVTYYSDELNDEFSTAQITPRTIDGSYWYGDDSLRWKILHLFLYKIVAWPIARVFMFLKYRHKIVNREILKDTKDTAFFIYGNHTNPGADALIPTFTCRPKHVFLIVHPNNVSIPGLGSATGYLGAIPLPDNLEATRNFMATLDLRVKEKRSIMIYPEAHIWPFYTKIRPFTDSSFKFPVKYKTPVYCLTNTYQKRRFSETPRMVTYVDGPFYPDENLNAKEQRKDLRDKVYNAMVERSKNNNVELIKYIKKETETDGE